MKIGLFGGTFNPIHNGHLNMINLALDKLDLDMIFVIPAGNSYFKRNVLDKDLRAEMVKLCIEDNKIENVIFSDVELNREGPSYSIDTIDYYINQYPESEIYFIIGEDSLYNIDKWYKASDILKKAIIAVFKRNNDEERFIASINRFKELYDSKIIAVEYDFDISSSEIREMFINDISKAKDYLSESVYKYIIDNKLYVN